MSNEKMSKNLSIVVKRELSDLDQDTHHLVVYLLQQVFTNNSILRERTIQNKMRANVRSEIEKVAKNPK